MLSGENTKVIELLQHENQYLIQENASINTIINIIVENHTFDISNLKSISEKFTAVNRKFRKKTSRPREHKKVDLNDSNSYETRYIIDSNTESESEDSDDMTSTDTSSDSNTRPSYTH